MEAFFFKTPWVPVNYFWLTSRTDMQSWKEPVVQHSNSFHIISKYVWGRLKVDSPMTGLLQLPWCHSRSMSGKFPRPLWISYMFTFLFLSHKWGGIGSFVTNTWERKMCIIPVRNQGGVEVKDTWAQVGSLSWYFARLERRGYTSLEGHHTLALSPIIFALFPRNYIAWLWLPFPWIFSSIAW